MTLKTFEIRDQLDDITGPNIYYALAYLNTCYNDEPPQWSHRITFYKVKDFFSIGVHVSVYVPKFVDAGTL